MSQVRRNRSLICTIAAALLAVALILAGCGRRAEGPQAPAADRGPILAVTASPVVTAPMESTLTLLGTTVALDHIVLRAPAAGRVLGMSLNVGDRVRKGEVVGYLMNREVEAAQQGLEIARKLDPKDASELARSVRPYTRSPGIPIVSPYNGVVAAPPVAAGQTVSYMDPVVNLIDPRSIYVEANVPVEDVAQVRPGMHVIISSSLRPGVKMTGLLAAMLPSVNPASATSAVRIDFTGSARIEQAGAPIEVRVVTKSVLNAMVIPSAALFQGSGETAYVFVAGADGRAHRTPVVAGIQTPLIVQVTSGLRPGESVITSGGYALSDGLRITVAQEPR